MIKDAHGGDAADIARIHVEALYEELEMSWLPIPGIDERERRGLDVIEHSAYWLLSFRRSGPFSNWVIPKRQVISAADIVPAIRQADSFYQQRGVPYSWEVFREMTWLEPILEQAAFRCVEQVEILVLDLTDHSPCPSSPAFDVQLVQTPAQLRRAIELDLSTEDYTPQQIDACLQRNLNRLGDPDHCWFLVRHREDAVAMASLEIHPASSMAYLSGGTTLLPHRGRGMYSALLQKRIAMARERGCRTVATHADSETSAPILRKHGFSVLSYIRVFQRT